MPDRPRTTLDRSVREVLDFLGVATPDVWLAQAADHRDVLVIDHANCEKKAAGTALNLLYRYIDRPDLLRQLSKLAREELRHFEQVIALMGTLGIQYRHVSPGGYAAELRRAIRTHEPARLTDTLLVSAIVEARSCERFHLLSRVFPDPLSGFYRRLLASEARHFLTYLTLARAMAEASLEADVERLLIIEADFVTRPADRLRFHSGPLM